MRTGYYRRGVRDAAAAGRAVRWTGDGGRARGHGAAAAGDEGSGRRDHVPMGGVLSRDGLHAQGPRGGRPLPGRQEHERGLRRPGPLRRRPGQRPPRPPGHVPAGGQAGPAEP